MDKDKLLELGRYDARAQSQFKFVLVARGLTKVNTTNNLRKGLI